jgi:hypothetical protein
MEYLSLIKLAEINFETVCDLFKPAGNHKVLKALAALGDPSSDPIK